MTRLTLALALTATPALSCDLTSAHVIGWTHHAGAEADAFDEGWGIRGGGLTVDCSGYELTGSAFKNSLHNGGMGYSVSLTHDDIALALGGLEMRPMAQINYYPDQRDNPAMWDGWFPTFGISFTYGPLFLNAYPTFGFDKSFDSLWVAGVTWEIE